MMSGFCKDLCPKCRKDLETWWECKKHEGQRFENSIKIIEAESEEEE
jgi:hypothetical protein